MLWFLVNKIFISPAARLSLNTKSCNFYILPKSCKQDKALLQDLAKKGRICKVFETIEHLKNGIQRIVL